MRLLVAAAHPPEELTITLYSIAGEPIELDVPPTEAYVTCLVLGERARRELRVLLPIAEWVQAYDALVAGGEYEIELASTVSDGDTS